MLENIGTAIGMYDASRNGLPGRSPTKSSVARGRSPVAVLRRDLLVRAVVGLVRPVGLAASVRQFPSDMGMT